eukprot:Nitzschia sp. Nitz4//scaffold21_size171442//168680//169189//NITZ4_002197-RA/size171442-processed-gene-0.35-mRNA-1//1//CDS//3329542519//4914//frame0
MPQQLFHVEGNGALGAHAKSITSSQSSSVALFLSWYLERCQHCLHDDPITTYTSPTKTHSSLHCKSNTTRMGKQLSGLQKEVLALYRTIIREAAKKDWQAQPANDAPIKLVNLWKDSTTTTSYAKGEFRKQVAAVKRFDFQTIEHKLRYGHKQVKILKMPGVKVVGGAH